MSPLVRNGQSNQLDENFNDSESGLDKPETNTVADNLKRRHSTRDLTYVFPSARTIDRYLEDASYLNLQMAANCLLNVDATDVVAVSFTIDELSCSIRNAIKPENELLHSIDTLLNSVL